MQDTGCTRQDARCRIQEAGFTMQENGHRPVGVGLQAKRGEYERCFGSKKEWAPLEEGGAHLFPEKTSGNRESEGDRNGTITLLQVQ
jgi:hypothetical protein